MSGHSKWSSIKHKKAARDAKRGKLFTKLIKEITIAARLGGGDINANPRLRTAVATAAHAIDAQRQYRPRDQKGHRRTRRRPARENRLRGLRAGGVAVIVDVLTDNRNRVVAEMRYICRATAATWARSDCVGWMFKKRGVITVEEGAVDEDKLIELALEAGADDVIADDRGLPGDDRAGGFQRRARRDREGQGSDRRRRGGSRCPRTRCGFPAMPPSRC